MYMSMPITPAAVEVDRWMEGRKDSRKNGEGKEKEAKTKEKNKEEKLGSTQGIWKVEEK